MEDAKTQDLITTGAMKLPARSSSTGTVCATISNSPFMPLHSVSYWNNDHYRRMATVSISQPSGYQPKYVGNSVKPSVSTCGMYLDCNVLWPHILNNFTSLGIGWREHDGFTPMEKTRMLCGSQEVYQDLLKTAVISMSTKLYAVCKIALKFEVERDSIEISVLMDEFYSTVLQVILKESKKDKDVSDHEIKVVWVSSHRTTSEPFDIADSVVPDVAVAVSEQQHSTQSTIQSQQCTPSTGLHSGTQVPIQFGIGTSTNFPGMHCSVCEEGDD
jgi:hypothetical protein